MNKKPAAQFIYSNPKGQTEFCEVIPKEIYYGTIGNSKEKQWIMDAIDKRTNRIRTYAMKNIHGWL